MNLRSTSALIFVVLYGIALIRPAMPIVDYYIKLDKYLEQCANKETSFCKGQCVLMQKIQMLDNRSHADVPPLPVTINMQEYPVAIIDPEEVLNTFAFVKPLKRTSVHCTLPDHRSHDIFHPPA
jgi:hypothetical protein